ncbi:hypothetical protein ABMA28_012767 [Loxostege sticticalis]|uniref:TIR domain-containing protein n=1 Tax=Loxostege sticticalis TaxID=481309 RepID=A0ABD0S4Z3_LOXSC
MLVATLLALVLTARALATECPASCDCGAGEGGAEREYICRQEGVVYQVNGLPNSFAKIHCESTNIDWTTIPFFPYSSNGTLESLTLSNCQLPSTFASVLANLGANDVRALTLTGAAGELGAEHVKGLRAVENIMMIYADDQTRIPYDVFAALPALKDFRIRGARLQLEENGGDNGPSAHPALRSVELASSGIADVPPGAFMRIKHVKKLYLWGNKIENFTSESFRGLDNLDTLDFTGNPVSSLPSRAFTAAPRLRSLTLVATRLAHVPTDAFEGLKELEEILFKFGRGSVKFSPRALASLPALKKLTFDRTPLDALPHDLLDGSTALEELTIKSTGLKTLPDGLFKTQQRIQKMDLSGNLIKKLESKIFWPLKGMKELILDENNIEEFPTQLFSGLENLTSVTANRNGLKYIADDAFQGATSLEFLSLNDNQLTLKAKDGPTNEYLDLDEPSPFQTLVNLKELHLQGNAISDIFSDWKWRLITNLRKLDLSRNNFTYLSKADLQFLAYNLEIDLRQNYITTIDVQPYIAGLPEDEGPKEKTNSVMLLDNNPFRCDCEIYMFIRRLHGAKRLTAEPKLDIGNARCASPPSFSGELVKDVSSSALTCSLRPQDCPANCTCDFRPATLSLELDCDAEPSKYPDPENHGLRTTKLRLRSIQSLTLPPHVVSLNLGGIGLTESPLLNLQDIKDLDVDLSGNLLTAAPVELLQANLTLRLARNPFACDCSHFDDVLLLQHYKFNIFDADNVTCSGGGSPWHMNAARLCDVRRATIIGGTLAALGIIAAFVAVFSYRYILEIKVYLFNRGWCQSLITEDELDKDAEYDAFVSFSEKDAKWVSEELLPKLEGAPNNFKLCVHYRDWVLGDMIPAQIARSVEQSRRTIVVLSENFLKSTWAQLEFRAANIRAQRERRARVLVIILGEVPDCEEMDAELRAYLSTNTYLKWGDRLFWERLKYAMPHKRRGQLNEVYVADKLKRGGLDARLNANGKIVNDAAQQRF